MDFRSSGSSSVGSTKCNIYPHPVCSACGNAVSRREQHSHDWAERGGDVRTLCRGCYGQIVAAAHVVWEALKAAGLSPTGRELDAMRREGLIGVLFQASFDIPISQN